MKQSIVENKDIKTNVYYLKFALQFADYSIENLVASFNHEVNNKGWTGMRAYHDQALIDEFQRRGIDISVVYDGKAISFSRPVKFDIADNKLFVVG